MVQGDIIVILIMLTETNLSGDISLAHDPYEKMLRQEKFANNLVPFDSSSKLAKKWTRFKGKMEGAKDNMIQGAIMGFLVGGLFGFAVGCYSAVQTRRFMAIPISTVISGVSFSFILGCGSMIRTAGVPQSPGLALEAGDWLSVYHYNQKSEALA